MSIGLALVISVFILSIALLAGVNISLKHLATVRQKQPPKVEVSLVIPDTLNLNVQKLEDREYLEEYQKKLDEYEKKLEETVSAENEKSKKEYLDMNEAVMDLVDTFVGEEVRNE